jgi:hypothetical protein
MNGNRGAALVLAMMALALLAALGLSLSVLANIEMRVAANYSHGLEMMSAAEAGLELTSRELLTVADWPAVASGSVRSAFNDGAPGTRTLPDGTSISLPRLTADLEDGRWQPFAHGAQDLWDLPIRAYVVVWARPDPSDGRGMLLRAEAFGPTGARRAVQAAVTRSRVLSWVELR